MERPAGHTGATPAAARAGLSIRTRALLVSLVLLAIPFVGYGYVREMERVLQAAQEQAVIGTARAVATALHDRPRLLDRRVDPVAGDAGYPRGTTVAATQEIELIIRGLRRSGSRIWVIDQDRRLLVLEGSLRQDAKPAVEPDLWDRIQGTVLGPLFALLLERPREDFEDALPEDVLSGGRAVDNALTGVPATRWRETADKRAVILAAAHPIWNGPEVIGAVVVEETTNRVLSLRNRAFEQLLTTTLGVFVLGALVLFLFATRISRRLTRLRDEAEHAIDARGRVHRAFRAERDRDEIGDLSRSFATVLDRLADYNDYLERMADRLSHELRTPIAVVSSSLDNLRIGPAPAGSQVYIQRAEEGVRRLNAILTRMSEARRLAETLKGTERERFDLGRVVAGCVAGYVAAFPQYRFELRLPKAPVELEGAPDLVAQLLDKLVDNARDFCAPGEPIEIAVDVEWDWARLAVSNVGPALPDAMAGQIFESMVSVRPAGGGAERPRGEPHLGLGLFIARLIAEFHGGKAIARNRPDGRGVVVEVLMPLAGAALPAPPAPR
ncbi:MAG TPA: ATP-binding protein [Burkholderiales bacterium]|nr:ATP-binding protein [Burkholderiales bacterium]